ncbi:MAG: hypothetical protein K6D97_03645 [Clostridia bacterium]|nr:hypothetical protein [Clostridia bacterium]
MDKFFKAAKSETSTEMDVVRALNTNPVEANRREDLPRFINVGVEKAWNKLSTYGVYRELIERSNEFFGKSDEGLCAYLAQCLVNPMSEAVTETRTDECDLTCVFGYDFKTHTGWIIKAEEIMDFILPYMTIYGCWEDENGVEYQLEIKVKE